jgi:hypothetical protein
LSYTGTVSVTFPQFGESGTWTIYGVLLFDAVGNRTDLTTTNLIALGFTTSLNVTSAQDITGPKLTGFTFAPISINTSSGSATVNVGFTVTDDLSGASSFQISFLSPSGTVFQGTQTSFQPSLSYTSMVSVTFPQFSESGTWSVYDVLLFDAAGNRTDLTTTNLIALGFPTKLQVTGGAPPRMLYHLCLLYDPTKAVQSGATMPIKLQLCDTSGNDLSSSSIMLHAVSVTQTSTSISGTVESSGNANPDNDFRFDSTLGSTGGYIFNLSTKGVATGSYNLNFTVSGDSFVYAAPFQVK